MKQTRTRHSPEPVQELARRKNTAANAGPNMAAQAKFVEGINSSPYIAAQRKKFQSLFGGAAQLEADPAQRVGEEEPLQGKFDPVQRIEEEEPLQGKFEPVQRVEEEEPLQGKFEAVQRIEEEEPLQGKFEPAQRVEEEEPLQGKFEPLQRVEQEEPLQGKFAPQAAQLEQQPAPRPNNTGLPDNLKTGIESLSGLSMDAVRVHYNSSQPAQLNALAYAQGTDIHVAPGQEKHLPHEAWHVVQQAQGRVQPTMQMKEGVPVNDDHGLEHEADVMGARALSARQGGGQRVEGKPGDGQKVRAPSLQNPSHPIQRMTTKKQYQLLATALNSWLQVWAVGSSENAVLTNLTQNWADAAELLVALLMSININPVPGNLAARNENRMAFPGVAPILLIDLLTVIHDLRTFGPTPNFRPQQTIQTVLNFYKAFSRMS